MQIKRFVMGELTTNCYVLIDENIKEAAVIDPAIYSEKLCKYFDDNGLIIKYVILTHGHFDHIMGCGELAKKYNAKVLISETESKLLTYLNKDFMDTSVLNGFKIDEVLNDGDVIKIGDISLDVIATPGHTPGGLSFYTDGVIFSGDILFKASIGRTDFIMGSFSDLENSIRKLYKYPDETVVYPGHGFTTKIGSEKLSNPFVR